MIRRRRPVLRAATMAGSAAVASAAVALIEHRWAIPLRDAIRRAGGVTTADAWVHPEDLVAAGAALGA
jgi:hypothetical protein